MRPCELCQWIFEQILNAFMPNTKGEVCNFCVTSRTKQKKKKTTILENRSLSYELTQHFFTLHPQSHTLEISVSNRA